MLKREHRLPSAVTFSNPHIARSPLFLLKYQETALPRSRAGIVISKRVSSSAVVRNRLKRLITTCLYPLISNTKTSVDILIIVQPMSATLLPEVFTEKVTDSLQKILK